MKDGGTAILYIGTAVMFFLSIIFIVLVVWSASTISKFKKFSKQRDIHYLERIDGLENLIRNEFKEVIKSLKNI